MIVEDDKMMSRYRPLIAGPKVAAFERQAVRRALLIGLVALFIGMGVVALRPEPSMLMAATPLAQLFSADD